MTNVQEISMSKISTFSLISLHCLTTAMALQRTASPLSIPELQSPLFRAINQFAIQMYNQITHENVSTNLLFSPFSVHSALTMVLQGAEGNTTTILNKTLNVVSADSASNEFKNIIAGLTGADTITLHIANKIYIMEGFILRQPFQVLVTRNFYSDVDIANFAQQEESANAINSWVQHKTKDRIKNLINSHDLSVDTRLVLVNAVYFKGLWATKFSKEFTRKRTFYSSPSYRMEVDMMHLFNAPLMYKEDMELNAYILQLPYTNEHFKMVIILPKEKFGLVKVNEKLMNYDWCKVVNHLQQVKVNVVLPKFKMEKTYDLKNILTNMGVGEIFDEHKANLRGITDMRERSNLFVSKVIQKVFIEVNEDGSEAAAATGVVIRTKRALPLNNEINFVADQPFIFAITTQTSEQYTNSLVLFFGSIWTME